MGELEVFTSTDLVSQEEEQGHWLTLFWSICQGLGRMGEILQVDTRCSSNLFFLVLAKRAIERIIEFLVCNWRTSEMKSVDEKQNMVGKGELPPDHKLSKFQPSYRALQSKDYEHWCLSEAFRGSIRARLQGMAHPPALPSILPSHARSVASWLNGFKL